MMEPRPAPRDVDGVPTLALRPEQAARALGVSRSFFFESILPELRVVRCGRVRLVPLRSLQDWLDRNAARPLEGHADAR
jgi:hypothetical protein